MATIPPGISPRQSHQQGQEFIDQVHQKMSKLVQEFAHGEINRTQFHQLYDRYQRQITTVAQMLAESDPASWRDAIRENEDTLNIKQRLTAKAVGLSVVDNQTGAPIKTLGHFAIEDDLIAPMLGSYRSAAAEIFRAGMRRVIRPTASERINNWGDAGTFMRIAVTDYLGDAAGFSKAVAKWKSLVDLIASDGHIPEETRRGSSGLNYTQEALDYKVYLARIVELTKRVSKPESQSSYPATINSPARRALYDNLDQNEQLAVQIDTAIRAVKKADFRGNRFKEREVRNAIKSVLGDHDDRAGRIFNIVAEPRSGY